MRWWAIGLVWCGLAAATTARAAESGRDKRLGFAAEGAGYRFETGVLRGMLHGGGKSLGLLPVVYSPTNTTITASNGVFSHYRLLDDTTRYGGGAWDWASTTRIDETGMVRVRWTADKDHPFDLEAHYRWRAPDTLDLVTVVTAKRDLRHFEVFLASYFAGFGESMVYVKDRPGGGGPGFLAAVQPAGDWQMFPRDAAAVPVITDGRWKREPNPVDWRIMPQLAAPLAMRRDAKSGLVALVMAPAEDCFAVSTPFGEEAHRSLYLSLLGGDVKAGRSAAARARFVLGKDLSAADAIERYRQYLDDIRRDVSNLRR